VELGETAEEEVGAELGEAEEVGEDIGDIDSTLLYLEIQ